MNVGQISSSLSAANLGTKIGFAVLNQTPLCLGKDLMVFDKNMDAMKSQSMIAVEAKGVNLTGEGMVRMIDSSSLNLAKDHDSGIWLAPTPSKVSMERSVNPHIGGNVDMLV